MIANFFSELAAVSPVLPLLVRLLILVLFSLLVWLVLAIPAHLLRRALDPFLNAAVAKVTGLYRGLFSAASRTISRWMAPLENFISVHAQVFSFAAENAQIRAEIARLRDAVERVPANIIALESGVVDAGNKCATAVSELQAIPIPPAVQAPDNQAFYAIVRESNLAWISLVIAVLVLPALIIFNTAMLSQIIDGWWGGIEFYGVAVSTILALGFTILEIALGIFVVMAVRPGARFLLIGLIVLVAFLEATFYGRMGKGMHWSLLDAWFAEGAAPAWTQQWLGLFGLVLVGCLAFGGHMFFSSLRKIGEHHVVSQWRSFIKQRIKTATQMMQRLTEVERARSNLLKSFEAVKTAFSTTTGVAGSNLAVIETAKGAFLAEIEKASKIRLEDSRKLDRGAMIRVFVESLGLVAGALIALFLTAYIYQTLTVAGAAILITGWWLGLVIAGGKGAILLLTGSITHRSNTTVAAGGGLPATASQGPMGQIIAYGILLVAIGGDAACTLKGLTVGGMVTFMLLVMADVMLLMAGTKLGLMGAALVSCLHSVGYALAAAFLMVAGALTWAVYLLLSLFRAALAVLSYPFRAVLFRRARPEEAAVGVAA